MDSASALRSRSSRCCRIAHCFQLVSHTNNRSAKYFSVSEKQVDHVWAVSRTYAIQLNRTDSRPPARSGPRTSPRRLGVRLSSTQQFFRYHTGKCQAIGLRPSRPSLKSSLETQTEKVELPSQRNPQPSNAQCYDHSGTASSTSPSRATSHELAQTE